MASWVGHSSMKFRESASWKWLMVADCNVDQSVAVWLDTVWLDTGQRAPSESAQVFTRESSYLAIAILSVRPSICHTGGSVKNGTS